MSKYKIVLKSFLAEDWEAYLAYRAHVGFTSKIPRWFFATLDRYIVKNKAKLEEMTGTTVFELLGFPPSIPGQRLQKSLETIFTKAGGKLLQGHKVIAYTRDDSRLKSITAKSPRREIKIDAKAFLLATGKYIGGGIAGNENGLKETVFDLMPVTGDYHSASDIIPSRSTSTLSISPIGQPIQSCDF